MSVPVGLEALQERIGEYGPNAFLVTTMDDGRPHTVTVTVTFEDGELLTGAGRTTAENIRRGALASLLWPAKPGDDYSLIVDGGALVEGDTAVIRPIRAVLHRSVWAVDEGPSCVTVL